MSKEQKITANLKVPNKDLENLKTHFPHCFDKNGKFDFEKFKEQLSDNEVSFSTESYSLEWLGKSYARILASDPATTLLKADETHNSKSENTNSENLLIKGDNLEVLKHLVGAYYEKIKMIYIDPPYNTGTDGFVYQDDRKFTVKELAELAGIDEEKAKRILDFTQSKSNSHSAWLTFMYPRLYIAKRLLREDGAVFVSIDDNEVASLRLLMDEIFGEENFVECIIWEKKSSAKGVPPQTMIVNVHEYILVYRKTESFKFYGEKRDVEKDGFKNPDNDPRGPWRESNIKSTTKPIEEAFTITDPNTGRQYTNTWAFSEESLKKMIKEGRILWKDTLPKQKEFLYEMTNENKAIKSSWGVFDPQSTTMFLKNLIPEMQFDNPKPINLMTYLLNVAMDKDDCVLDFFAGSGTTGQAVTQLNAVDGGNRKFILVQLPEPIDPKKNKTSYDFIKNELKAKPTIFEITKERLIRAAKKIKTETIDKKIEEKQKEINELKGKLDLENKDEKIKQLKQEIKALEQQDLGFKIFETMPIWEDYNFEAEQFDSSQTLFDADKLTEDDIKALLITWKTYDGIPLTKDLEYVDLGSYNAFYGNGKLYLMHKGFKTNHLKNILEKIDSDKSFEPRSIIAFGYHFESARLRELSENIKSYSNKKHIDIDFIIRY